MKNFSYLLGPADGPECVLVDPAWEPEVLLDAMASDGKRLVGILLTHHHADHLNAVGPLLAHHDLPVYAQKAEVDVSETLRGFGAAVRAVGAGTEVAVGALSVTCVHTPGHTPGSQCFVFRGQLVAGDTLFVGACGRCDMPGGDMAQMYHSLHTVLGALPASTVLWPGHDYGHVVQTTLEAERKTNKYLTVSSYADFAERRGHRS
jgi:hydroxyacylglutathione hydrolase